MDIKPAEAIEACPFCRGRCVDVEPMPRSTTVFYPYVTCTVCQYVSPGRGTAAEAIAAHNVVARAVRLYGDAVIAIQMAISYAQDGQQADPEIKAWAIDQMCRALLSPEGYRALVEMWNNAPPVSIRWEEGKAP